MFGTGADVCVWDRGGRLCLGPGRTFVFRTGADVCVWDRGADVCVWDRTFVFGTGARTFVFGTGEDVCVWDRGANVCVWDWGGRLCLATVIELFLCINE